MALGDHREFVDEPYEFVDPMEDDPETYEFCEPSLQTSYGTFEVTRSVNPFLPVGETVEMTIEEAQPPFLCIYRASDERLLYVLSPWIGRWQEAPDGLDVGVGVRFHSCLRPLGTDPAGQASALLAAMDEERRKVVAEMCLGLGIVGERERFACTACGRAASVQAAYDGLTDLLTLNGIYTGLWSKMHQALVDGMPRVLPGWLEIEDPLQMSSDEAVEHLDALASLGVLRRDGIGYVPTEPRCADCLAKAAEAVGADDGDAA